MRTSLLDPFVLGRLLALAGLWVNPGASFSPVSCSGLEGLDGTLARLVPSAVTDISPAWLESRRNLQRGRCWGHNQTAVYRCWDDRQRVGQKHGLQAVARMRGMIIPT